MKLMLLGANGQLGREWQHQLNENSPNDCTFKAYSSSRLDITQFAKVEKEITELHPEVIINCAAYTKVDKAEAEREIAKQVNATAVKNIARVCAKNAIKLIHFSTDYVFAGEMSDQKRFPKGYPEDHPAEPVNWYGQTKWEGEQAIRKSGCKHLILRLSWLCGFYGNNFVTTMLRLAEGSDGLKVVDDQYASPTFTQNTVENVLKLIELKREGTYHLTCSGLISWAEFARAIFEIAGKEVKIKPIPTSEYPTEAKRPQFSKLSTKKIELEGIKIEDWKVALKQMLTSIEL